MHRLLARAGAADGDVVWIGEFSFEYRDVTVMRVVVKVGTSSVTDERGAIDDGAIAKLRRRGRRAARRRARGRRRVVGRGRRRRRRARARPPARPTCATLQALVGRRAARLMRSWDAALGRPRPRAGPGAARARTTSSTAASTCTPGSTLTRLLELGTRADHQRERRHRQRRDRATATTTASPPSSPTTSAPTCSCC